LFGRAIGAKASEYVTTLFLVVAALLSWVAFFTVAMGDGAEPGARADHALDGLGRRSASTGHSGSTR
jgi:NADH:ubiquinone oxidoreductase subunit 5 (subunit L)/multisubunit Na+/H+ antiporter MnhA subunit